MNFNLEGRKSQEIKETPESKVNSEQLAETEKNAENFDDCAPNEVGAGKGAEVNAESLKEAEEDYDDCKAKVDKMEGEKPELAEDDDDFNECGNEVEGKYVAKVTYTTDGEISRTEAVHELQQAYNKCEDKEDMQQLKRNANANEHIEVHTAEVIEKPEITETVDESDRREYEEARKQLEEAEEKLKDQQEIAEEYQKDLENQMFQSKNEVSEQMNQTGRIEQMDNDPLSEADANESNEMAGEANSEEKKLADKSPESAEAEEKAETTEAESEKQEKDAEKKRSEKPEEDFQDDTLAKKSPDTSVEENVLAEDKVEPEKAIPTGEPLHKETSEAKDIKPVENATEGTAEEKTDAVPEFGKDAEDYSETADSKKKAFDTSESEHTEQTKPSLEERIDGVFNKEDVSADEINLLREENATELRAKLEAKDTTDALLKSKFDEVLSKERGDEEYKQSLREYNALKDTKAELDEQIVAMKNKQELLEKKSLALRDAQIEKGSEAMVASVATLAGVAVLQDRYDRAYYETKPDKGELSGIREDNCCAIKDLTVERDSLKQAMDAKMDQISDYVISNNMDRYETSRDPYYQKLTQEYLSIKESYDRTAYSIVKLDENNKAITERLGDEYVSMVKKTPLSRIIEVNQGTDIPGETDYFMDKRKAEDILAPFREENWEKLSVWEQKQAVAQLAEYNAEILGVEDKPAIRYYLREDSSDFGGFSQKHNTIYVNEYNLHDATETADTISHEYRHKYQHERAEKLENERDLAFKEGFEDYIRPEDDYFAYKNQLVEADARKYAVAVQTQITQARDNLHTGVSFDPLREAPQNSNADHPPRNSVVWSKTESVAEKYTAKEKNKVSESTFLTNDGRKTTHAEAIRHISQWAKKHMDAIGVDEQKQHTILADIRNELTSQQIEAESRALGDHGIRHIFGNIERGEHYLSTRADVSSEEKLAVLVAQVYHDEGYTFTYKDELAKIDVNNSGLLRDGKDGDHDKASLLVWNEKEKLFDDVFSEETKQRIQRAIGEHNVGIKDEDRGGAETIRMNTSLESDVIVSTVHICDKLALSQREKFSELLLSNPELVELTTGMNAAMEPLLKPELGLFDKRGRPISPVAEKLLKEYHTTINTHIGSKNYPADYAARLKEAAKKDLMFSAGKFSNRMNYVYTPSDCFFYNPKTGENEIHIDVISRAGEALVWEQPKKLLEDLGLSGEELNNALTMGEYVDPARRLRVRLTVRPESEILAEEAKRFQENKDLREVNERIEAGKREYASLRNKLTEIVGMKSDRYISFRDYSTVADGIRDPRFHIREEEFNRLPPMEKKALLDAVCSHIILKTAEKTLKKKGVSQ